MSWRPGDGQVEVVLAVDAGTTGVTVLMVTEQAEVIARGYAEFGQHFPRPGWVEHAPEEIWQATLTATQVALDAAEQTERTLTYGVAMVAGAIMLLLVLFVCGRALF